MRAHVTSIRLVLLAVLAGMTSLADAGPLRLEVQMPTAYTGTEFSYLVQVRKENVGDGMAYTGPFTVHSYLPAGMSFVSASLWDCTILGADGTWNWDTHKMTRDGLPAQFVVRPWLSGLSASQREKSTPLRRARSRHSTKSGLNSSNGRRPALGEPDSSW